MKAFFVNELEKVFPDEEPKQGEPSLSGLRGETVCCQAAYYYDGVHSSWGRVSVHSDIPCRVRKVETVPSRFPCHNTADEDYLRYAPGLFPDLLQDLEDGIIRLPAKQWHSIWIDFEIGADSAAGTYEVAIEFAEEDGKSLAAIPVQLQVIGTVLPPLPIKHTEWLHGDCLADFYGVEVFSEEHWRILEEFIAGAAKRDINMILTPVFTPPLDTARGGERTTIQLVDVYVEEDGYRFDFSSLERWLGICRKHRIQYLEISHLFTQWGAGAAPKIMAWKDGLRTKLFGWHTAADSDEYKEFLGQFLPKLTEQLKAWQVAERTFFHISDEPGMDDLESYRKAKEIVAPYLEGFQIVDALSNYEFYKTGLVEQPICATDHIDTFLEHQVPDLWSYYCTSQGVKVSNRFMSMPSYRNRIYGLQVYLTGMSGLLHWGYNFYNSQFSKQHINPYYITDADYGFPSGDSYIVYPKADGTPEESIRIMVLYRAMTDIRALYLLESLTSREFVGQVVEEEGGSGITFSSYPRSARFCLGLRERINREIADRI